MSIEGENRELLFQELYNMVGYHLAKYNRMPSLSFDDENPKSADPTKHVVYKEGEGKIVIHTGRFKMKEAEIKERLREGFECEIDVDGQTGSVKYDFASTPKNDNSIRAVDLDGYLTSDGRILQMSQDRKEKYYTEKKAPLKDRNPEDGNERLEELFRGAPNKGPKENNNSVQNIMNRYGNNVGPQPPEPQQGGQSAKDDGWLTDTILCYPSVRRESVDMLLGEDSVEGKLYPAANTAAALMYGSAEWGKSEFAATPLNAEEQQSESGPRSELARIGRNMGQRLEEAYRDDLYDQSQTQPQNQQAGINQQDAYDVPGEYMNGNIF